jgi:cytochrome oxidase assembly protein ShyY1
MPSSAISIIIDIALLLVQTGTGSWQKQRLKHRVSLILPLVS